MWLKTRQAGVVGDRWAILVVSWAVCTLAHAADGPVYEEAWRTSPFHGAISGATGQPIPCLCRYRVRTFKLGEQVCMSTPNGVVITRCDMFLNNTSWVPTNEPCTISFQSRPAEMPRHGLNKS